MPSRSRTTTQRPRSSCTQPKFSVLVPDCPERLMTSPGLIDRSMSNTKPLTKLAAIDCKPKPKPKPTAPVSTVSAVRSTPAAFKPMSMLKAIRNALANFAMPMRVDIATLVSRLTRRSTQRLIQAATNMNSVSVNSSFNTDQTVMRLLPAATPRLSSVAMIGSSHPRYSAAIASQMSSATRLSQSWIQDLLPRLAANTSTAQRTTMYAKIRRAASPSMVTSKCDACSVLLAISTRTSTTMMGVITTLPCVPKYRHDNAIGALLTCR